jgi:mono/diheme cytochrome c family protein
MRVLAVIGALAVVIAIAAGAYLFGGFYSVAANEEGNPVIDQVLVRVRTASIDRHAGGKPPLKFDDPATVRDGARAFARHGCVNCHGAPGVEWAKFSEGLNPDPPDLKEAAAGTEPEKIFWVVKNGIRMTGMPSFGKAGVADNEIWQIVSFVKALPKVSEADYKSWTAQNNQ